MNNTIIGRINEKEILKNAYESKTSEFVVLYGRRRVGKSFLINEYFKNNIYFDFSGIYNETKSVVFRQFLEKLSIKEQASTWYDCFSFLRKKIISDGENEKKVIFLDEFPWLDLKNSKLIQAFSFFVNDFVFKRHDILLIISGSTTSWIIKKILNNYGGLYNRATKIIKLLPFTLNECELFFKEKKEISYSRYNIVESYMIFGGIPYYLDYFRKDLSFIQNIDNILFNNYSPLKNEKNRLFESMFKNYTTHLEVINLISKKYYGISRHDIITELKLAENGNLTNILNDLIECGFIMNLNNYPNKKKNEVFVISDNFILFSSNFLENKILDNNYFENNYLSQKLYTWRGLAFERVVLQHIPQLKFGLGISRLSSNVYTLHNDSTQIDILLDRKDQIINLCEIKFSINEFEIDKEYDITLRNKIANLSKLINKNKTINLTFITTYGVKKNMYSSIVGENITITDLFSK